MSNEFKISICAFIIQFLEFLFGTISLFYTNAISNNIFFYCMILSSIITGFFAIKYYNISMYVNFIEFLMNNDRHKFILLPKIRMCLHSEKISNKVKIKSIDVIYNIKANKEADNEFLGDAEIYYKLTVENKNIPSRFDFIFWNDYSTSSQNVTYRYGFNSNAPFQAMHESFEKIAPYWKGSLKRYDFGVEPQQLPQGGDLEIEIKIVCTKSFDFKNLPRDTIICLPKIFSNDVAKMVYSINLFDFDTKFYCDTYRVCQKGLGYTIDNIGCDENSDFSFKKTLFPNEIKGEKAFYFRVGLDAQDREIMN